MTSRLERNKQNQRKIDNEEKKQKFNKILKVIFKILFCIFIVLTFIFSIMYFIGNSGLVVKEYSLDYDNLPESFYGIKVVHISDINYGQRVTKNKLNKVQKKINSISPDIVVFTGNLINTKKKINKADKEVLISFLNGIDSSVGKYLVKGNNDNDLFTEIVNETDFEYLENEMSLVYYKGLIPIQILGFNKDINDNVINEYKSELFTIALVHEPDKTKDILKQYNPSLILAGCSLNKQINVPYIKDLINIDGALTYNKEYYKVNDTDLYISSGIGTLKYPFRLFNHPSFNLYRLK